MRLPPAVQNQKQRIRPLFAEQSWDYSVLMTTPSQSSLNHSLPQMNAGWHVLRTGPVQVGQQGWT